ncbi:MAG TPA: CoA transferase [Candidatus Limnocylindria bacterium]|jgi:benzylsuccinate CoA-transferase BbsE subunit|nr:CoA transferase [Candidatus Limnocylindria bacterium]
MPPPLAGLRALDLTDALGYLCGRLLADLGVEVIKVEPPGGDPDRALPPRWRAPDGREHGLYWQATNAGKLGVTLALEHAETPHLLADLVAHVDFVLDSFPPDSAAARLVAEVAAARPALVHTSVTPFGDRPPGRALHADDIVIAAMGGSMYLCGDQDRPPLRLPLWQAFCHAGAEAAVGTLLAHLARGRSGRGQHVVVNAQAAMVWTLMNAQAFPVFHGDYLRRSGPYVGSRGVRRRMVFPCADGHVSLLLMGAQGAPSTRALMGWMDEHGMLPGWLREWPWEQWEPGWAMEASPAAQAELVRIEEAVAAFLQTRPKAEVYREGVRRRILVAPVATVADIAADPQLAFREYFRPVDDPTLGRTVRYPGPFARLSATPLAEPRRPPEPGEHNARVYRDLCGHDPDALRRAGVI